MKYVFIVIVFLVCCGAGYAFSIKYSKRKKFFSSLISLAEKLALEINFSRERLKVLLQNFDDSSKRNLLGIDEKFVEYLDKKCELTQEEVFKKADCLKTDEKEAVLLFLKTLGRSDVENQTKEIESFVTRFEETKKKCDEEQKKYGSLSMKLGVVAGLFCAIILI
ncbi:MAG: stage III sporulation protein AB [Clostridia bacterium]|nr:stage III sporulation protein AB [Clostridia bacterium]